LNHNGNFQGVPLGLPYQAGCNAKSRDSLHKSIQPFSSIGGQMKKPKPIDAWGIKEKTTQKLKYYVYETKKQAEFEWPLFYEPVRVRISVIEKAKRK
jgi:hypothetical protein